MDATGLNLSEHEESGAVNDTNCDTLQTPWDEERFYLNFNFGVSLAALGFLENLFVFTVIWTNYSKLKQSHYFYLWILALFDQGMAHILLNPFTVSPIKSVIENHEHE